MFDVFLWCSLSALLCALCCVLPDPIYLTFLFSERLRCAAGAQLHG